MTVRELIEALAELHPDRPVRICNPEKGFSCRVAGIEQFSDHDHEDEVFVGLIEGDIIE